jgi:hypothetical protein
VRGSTAVSQLCLALGKLGDARAEPLLREVDGTPGMDATVSAAAAAAVARLHSDRTTATFLVTDTLIPISTGLRVCAGDVLRVGLVRPVRAQGAPVPTAISNF